MISNYDEKFQEEIEKMTDKELLEILENLKIELRMVEDQLRLKKA